MKNGHLVAPKNPCDFRQVYCIVQWESLIKHTKATLKFYYLSFGTNKTTICYAKYIHTYTSEMKKWLISGTRESLQISKISLHIAVYIVSYIYESHTLRSYVTSFFGANKYLI